MTRPLEHDDHDVDVLQRALEKTGGMRSIGRQLREGWLSGA